MQSGQQIRLTTFTTSTLNTIFEGLSDHPQSVGAECSELLDSQGAEDLNISISTAANRLNSEVTSFTDQNPSYVYAVDSEPDATFGVADIGDVSLAKFLSRPVLIQSFNWETNAPAIYERFNPWADFFSEPRIANRIAHYAYMRAKLKVRVLINGNQFHYGRAILSYIPLPNFDKLTVDRPYDRFDVVQASQRPHIYIDPTYSQGGELHLPFFFHKNMLEIANNEFETLGEMVLHTINVLKHANGADDKVTINVFAWAEDVVLSGPTSATGTLTPQSGEDEYGVGIVSKPAGIVSRIAKKLTSIPPIAPYARATEIAAGSLSAIASMLGYCRPNDITTIHSFRPLWGGNLANTNVEDTALKLSVDAKQELTLDPRTTGLSGVDELGIKNIASRESYLTTFDWPVSAQRDDKLFANAVSPIICPRSDPNSELFMPACAFATLPFQWWRGTMKFRFQIVSSNYHRGRLRLVYEPFSGAPGLAYTTNYNRIIDIAEEKDFTVEIGWNQNLPYKQNHRPYLDPVPFGPTYVSGSNDFRNNGNLTVFVVNDLTVPNSLVNNDIQVNVFVSCGDDFEVAGPTGEPMRRYTFFPQTTPVLLDVQSGETVVDTESTSAPSAPMQEATQQIGSMNIDDNDATNHVFFGEEIKSFRPMLKRYQLHNINTPDQDVTGAYWWDLRNPAFPYARGETPNPCSFEDVNVCENTLLNYVSVAFTGWRGGIRRKLFFSVNDEVAAPSDMNDLSMQIVTTTRFQNYTTNIPYENDFSTVDTSSAKDTLISQQGILNDFLNGGSANPISNNPVQDVEIPFYSAYRFLPTKRDSNDISSMGRFNPPTYRTRMRANSALGRPQVMDFVATGEDFNLFFFTGCPILYRADIMTPL